MSKLPVRQRVERSVARSTARFFVRADFKRLGSFGQVGRVLRSLIARGLLVKAGYGIYVKARKSSVSGRAVPVASLVEIDIEALAKLSVAPQLGSSARSYANGRTTQLPMATVLNVGKSRVTRRIGFGSHVIRYER